MTIAHLTGGPANGQTLTLQHDTPCLRLQSACTPKVDSVPFWGETVITYWIYPLGPGPHQLYIADFHESHQNN